MVLTQTPFAQLVTHAQNAETLGQAYGPLAGDQRVLDTNAFPRAARDRTMNILRQWC